MSDFKDRLKTELEELTEKITKLKSFLDSGKLLEIDEVQGVLLEVQYQSMKTYQRCLKIRLERLDDE
jgi:hypothetical protein